MCCTGWPMWFSWPDWQRCCQGFQGSYIMWLGLLVNLTRPDFGSISRYNLNFPKHIVGTFVHLKKTFLSQDHFLPLTKNLGTITTIFYLFVSYLAVVRFTLSFTCLKRVILVLSFLLTNSLNFDSLNPKVNDKTQDSSFGATYPRLS